jgi:hypothetical protein
MADSMAVARLNLALLAAQNGKLDEAAQLGISALQSGRVAKVYYSLGLPTWILL